MRASTRTRTSRVDARSAPRPSAQLPTGAPPQSREGTPLEERECPQDLEAMSHDELLEEFVRLCLRLNAKQLLMVREILRSGLMPGRPPPD